MTAHLQNWIQALKRDSRLILSAASQAQRAVDMILNTAADSLTVDGSDLEKRALQNPVPEVAAR